MASKTRWDILFKALIVLNVSVAFHRNQTCTFSWQPFLAIQHFPCWDLTIPNWKAAPHNFSCKQALSSLRMPRRVKYLADWTKQARMDNYWGSVWSQAQLCNYAISMRPNQTLRGGRKLFILHGRSTKPAVHTVYCNVFRKSKLDFLQEKCPVYHKMWHTL